jgi:hypothetical protein
VTLTELAFTAEQQRLVDDLEALHAVLDICVFSYADGPDEYVLARQAAVAGMRVFHRKYLERLRQLDPGRDLSGLFTVRVHAGVEPTGEIVSPAVVIGASTTD